MQIKRFATEQIGSRLLKGKALILLGPRQCGKTTLMRDLLRNYKSKTLYLNGDDADVRASFIDVTAVKMRRLIGSKKILFIDEAQRIPDIGIAMKIITDQIPGVQVVATGSSSLELASKTSESLTGRKFEYHLYPLSFGEMVLHHGVLEEKRFLEQRLVYGYYPEIVTHPDDAEILLKELVSSYLYKDLLVLDGIHRPTLLEKILKALALQVGQQVSFNELSQLVGADRKTVERYIELLEKAFVVFQVRPFHTNKRNELKKMSKIYYYDNGVLNAMLGNFEYPSKRSDVGGLWENFLLSERVKYLANNGISAHQYYWRAAQQEIDYVEQRSLREPVAAFEFKWNPKAKSKMPATFLDEYKPSVAKSVNSSNFDDFLLD